MENESLPILLITANVGSVFEDPSNLLHLWIKEFLDHIAAQQPAFIALHLQEVGGKTYEKSMEYVQEFIKQLCESDELRDYNRIRVYLDEDYNSAEHFTERNYMGRHSTSQPEKPEIQSVQKYDFLFGFNFAFVGTCASSEDGANLVKSKEALK
uniref:Inositol polyphosphate-related phosphatase domain-containing protein n=1 Tax=Anopheles maculatus TaxID=74869 RepID=A0A182SL07_9DIPT